MSRLYVRQKVFSWRDHFTVKNEYGEDLYTVEGEFSLVKKLHVRDMTGNEVLFLKRKAFSFLPRFHVFVRGIHVGDVVRRFTVLRPVYEIEGLGWRVQGTVMAHDYSITGPDRAIANIHKVWLSWGDAFEIEVIDDRDTLNVLAVVLAIDAVMDEEDGAAAASSSSSG